MLRRIGILTSLAAVAVMFAGVSSAQAQTVGTCVFTGLPGDLQAGDGTHAPAENHGIQNIQPDLLGGSLGLDVERGSYRLSGAGDCVGVLDGEPVLALDTPRTGSTTTSCAVLPGSSTTSTVTARPSPQ